MGPLEPLWRLLREEPDPRHTAYGWEARLGAAYPAIASRLQPTRDRAGTWTCGALSTACCRIVIEHAPDDLVAVCCEESPRCPTVRLARTALGLHRVDLVAMANTVGAALSAKAAAFESSALIGPVDLGRRRVVFVVTRIATVLGLLELADELRSRHRGCLVVVLAPVDASLRPAETRAFERIDAEVVPLSSVLDVDDTGLVADLCGWVLSHREELQGADPIPLVGRRFDLVLDPLRDSCWLWGTPVDFRRLQKPRLLLEGLARHAGRTVTRDALFDEVWPERQPDDLEGWEVSLRSHKKKLERALAPAFGVRPSPIEAVAGTTVDGGYRLAIEPTRVLWWTSPHA